METCCVCGNKVFDMEEAEMSTGVLYCDVCIEIIKSGAYPSVNTYNWLEGRFRRRVPLNFES